MKTKNLTLTLTAVFFSVVTIHQIQAQEYTFDDLPEPVTSFGAVAEGDWIYVLGGHAGESHVYSSETTLDNFIRIPRDGSGGWEPLAPGVRAQGASLVAHDGKIYRIGGLVSEQQDSRNAEEAVLNSLDDFARFDPATGQWETLPPMPAARSSHDSVVVDDRLYVLGGWEMKAGKESRWHDVMFIADLSADRIEWKTGPQPFQRRAIAVGAVNHRIYAMGGMDAGNETSLQVDVFETESGQWSRGPELPMGVMKGFGAAATVFNEQLFVSPYAKEVLRLNADAGSWQSVGELDDFRFFHRLLPIDASHLVAIGGASRAKGHTGNLEVISIADDLHRNSEP